MEEEIDRFGAASDDGRMFTVIVYQRVVNFRGLASGPQGLGGAKRLALSDGRRLNAVKGDPEAFQIFDTDEIIRKLG